MDHNPKEWWAKSYCATLSHVLLHPVDNHVNQREETSPDPQSCSKRRSNTDESFNVTQQKRNLTFVRVAATQQSRRVSVCLSKTIQTEFIRSLTAAAESLTNTGEYRWSHLHFQQPGLTQNFRKFHSVHFILTLIFNYSCLSTGSIYSNTLQLLQTVSVSVLRTL